MTGAFFYAARAKFKPATILLRQKVAGIAPLRFAPPLAWKICKHIFTAHRYAESCRFLFASTVIIRVPFLFVLASNH